MDQIPTSESFQAGGNVTLLNGGLVSRVSGKDIQDPSGLGRWSGVTLEGNHGQKLSILTTYRVCKGSIKSASLGSAFAREHQRTLCYTVPADCQSATFLPTGHPISNPGVAFERRRGSGSNTLGGNSGNHAHVWSTRIHVHGGPILMLSVIIISFIVVAINTTSLALQSEGIKRTATERQISGSFDHFLLPGTGLTGTGVGFLHTYTYTIDIVYIILPRGYAAGQGYTVLASRSVHGANPIVSSYFIRR